MTSMRRHFSGLGLVQISAHMQEGSKAFVWILPQRPAVFMVSRIWSENVDWRELSRSREAGVDVHIGDRGGLVGEADVTAATGSKRPQLARLGPASAIRTGGRGLIVGVHVGRGLADPTLGVSAGTSRWTCPLRLERGMEAVRPDSDDSHPSASIDWESKQLAKAVLTKLSRLCGGHRVSLRSSRLAWDGSLCSGTALGLTSKIMSALQTLRRPKSDWACRQVPTGSF